MTFQVGCKLSLVLFQYCIMANFYWLLVEGLYLHTLLVAIFSPGRRFVAYLLIGWGKDCPLCVPDTLSATVQPSRPLFPTLHLQTQTSQLRKPFPVPVRRTSGPIRRGFPGTTRGSYRQHLHISENRGPGLKLL